MIEMMNNALKYCETEISGARQPTCQYRAATIHHRLASLFHNSYRNQVSQHIFHLCLTGILTLMLLLANLANTK